MDKTPIIYIWRISKNGRAIIDGIPLSIDVNRITERPNRFKILNKLVIKTPVDNVDRLMV